MKKQFSSSDAIRLVNKHLSLLNELKSAIDSENTYKDLIESSADRLFTTEMLKILNSISVDELNKYKRGIRVKTLHEANFNTIADLYTTSTWEISSVRGISQDAAYTIKRLVKDIVTKVQKETKIKLSLDSKTKESTQLVVSISKYRNCIGLAKEGRKILLENSNDIKELIDEIRPATNVVRWLFASKLKKERALSSYETLTALLNSEYKAKANELLLNFDEVNRINGNFAWDDFAENSVQFFTILEDIAPGLLGTDDTIYGLPENLAKQVQDECFFPDGLLCTLRRYQEWGVKYILHQGRVLLGDEMGLGKTIQAIATMVSLKNTGATHFIVVCPASVITNWCREINKHSLLKATKIHGQDRKLAFQSWLQTGGVAVTTYETTAHLSLDSNFKFSMAVVDEAHYIKNPDAKRTINTVNLCKHADRLLFMTGTALENRVDEMIWLIEVLQPQIAKQVYNIAFMSSAQQFRERIAPVYYRRKRDDVLTELPELIETKEWCPMNPEEEKIYEDAILSHSYSDARRVSWNIDDLNNSSKATRLKEIVEEAESEGRKILVFSFFLDTIRKICSFLEDRCLNPINGSVTPQRRQEIIDEFEKAPPGTVLVSQIQSGGTGLNIQAASVVVICEPQFKPSTENQAISRAYRMGQARNVLVYRLLCENSIDERITELLEEKQAIFDAFADKSVAANQIIEVDDKSFGNIISEEIERINAKRGITNQQSFDEGQGNAEYYNSLLNMSYKELVSLFLEKYGAAKYDYFVNENCKTKNSAVSRTKEGLFCHHIDEDKAILLSNDKFAANNPFSYQKADRLVYCNILEHLLLHIKIAEEPRNENANKNEITGIGGAINFICKQINDYYDGHVYTVEYMAKAMEVIKNDYNSYIKILNYFWKIINNNPMYSLIIKKEDLATGWEGNIVEKILKDIE